MDAVFISESGISPDASVKWRLFIGLILLATLVPCFVMPFSVHVGHGSPSVLAVAAFINFMGSGVHVGSSLFFYTDKELRGFFSKHKMRYYYIIIVLILLTGLCFNYFDSGETAYLMIFYFIWQTYHYQKQNYGILSFIAAGTDRIPPSFLERAVLQTSVWLGILGLLKINDLSKNTLLEPLTGQIYLAAEHAFWLVPFLYITAIATSKSLRKNPTRMLFLAIGGLFYLPTFLFHDSISAISGYALGHGLQYLIFMYFVGASKSDRDVRVLVLSAIALVSGASLTLLADQSLWGRASKFIFGAYLGMVMAHFVIDAGVWRLRDPFQRQYMKSAFSFIFMRNSSTNID